MDTRRLKIGSRLPEPIITGLALGRTVAALVVREPRETEVRALLGAMTLALYIELKSRETKIDREALIRTVDEQLARGILPDEDDPQPAASTEVAA